MLTRSLTLAGTPGTFRGLGAASLIPSMPGPVSVARAFGGTTSVPSGFSSGRGFRLAVKTSGRASARARARASLSATLRAIGNASASFFASATMVGGGNVLLNGYATAVVTVTMTAAIRAVGNASASFDILSRPSAFDIAQEVWNAQKAAFAGAGTMGAAQSEVERAAKLAVALSA